MRGAEDDFVPAPAPDDDGGDDGGDEVGAIEPGTAPDEATAAPTSAASRQVPPGPSCLLLSHASIQPTTEPPSSPLTASLTSNWGTT